MTPAASSYCCRGRLASSFPVRKHLTLNLQTVLHIRGVGPDEPYQGPGGATHTAAAPGIMLTPSCAPARLRSFST